MRWVRFPLAVPADIEWGVTGLIMLQSGEQVGIVRDYGDNNGDPNNLDWFGRIDSYSDGADDSFQAYGQEADPNMRFGNVTLSVYVEYAAPPTQ